jgi:hypothetical protein
VNLLLDRYLDLSVKRIPCVLGILVLAGCGSRSSAWEVHPDGRIGGLKIDLSTEAEIRSFAGKPFKVERVFSEAKKDPIGYELYYRCGRGCITSYAISYATGKLSDFHSLRHRPGLACRDVSEASRCSRGTEDRRGLRGGALHSSALGPASHLRSWGLRCGSVSDRLPRTPHPLLRGSLLRRASHWQPKREQRRR